MMSDEDVVLTVVGATRIWDRAKVRLKRSLGLTVLKSATEQNKIDFLDHNK